MKAQAMTLFVLWLDPRSNDVVLATRRNMPPLSTTIMEKSTRQY